MDSLLLEPGSEHTPAVSENLMKDLIIKVSFAVGITLPEICVTYI